MCGIAGILELHEPKSPAEGDIGSMLSQLHHRGPDGRGWYINGRVGLGHTRLSIIDLAGGAQPIHNEDKTVWVVFNGEIFNYVELRADLVTKGHRFYTQSDTEVIVHLYEQYGEDFVRHLNGQFAIALWDVRKERLLLVRDRAGILPLFYTVSGNRLIFASEIKAILPVLGRQPSLNPDALDQIMTFWTPVSPATIFRDIFEVMPGECLTVSGGKISRRRYWDWQFPEDGGYSTGSADEIAEHLRDLLDNATDIRLRSDVPVGAYLSGGLDSSVLTALMHRHCASSIRTFSISFEDRELDESSYQKEMIDFLGAEHSSMTSTTDDIAGNFIDTVWHAETPMLRTAPVPMRQLSGLVRGMGYKVVLTGEGSDEVLGGYDIFKEAKIRQFWARNPVSTIRPALLQRLYPYLDMSRAQSRRYLESFFGTGLDNPQNPFFSHMPRWITTSKCKEFLSGDLRRAVTTDPIRQLQESMPENIMRWHPFNRSQYIEARTLMSGYLLSSQGDRMLMASSVEGRFPFLDHRVIELANQLHPKLKMRALNEKYILKKAMQGRLPQGILNRHKQPYRAPNIPSFFGAGAPEYVADLLSDSSIKRTGYFDYARVGKLVNKIRLGRAIGNNDNMSLVGILSTQVWHHHFVEGYAANFLPDNKSGIPTAVQQNG